MVDILTTIAQRISRNDVTPTCIVLGKDGYQSVPLAITNFKQIPAAKDAVIAFVDSGNAELSRGPNYSLQFIRAFATILENGKRKAVRDEGYCLVQATQHNGKLAYTTELFGLALKLPAIDLYEQSLAEGTHRVEPSRVAELVRVLAEHKLAARAASELPTNAFLVRDGDLQAHTLFEQNALRELYAEAWKRGVTIAGVSKTSTLLTDTGHAATPALLHLAPKGTWYYHPIAVSTRADHQATVSVARLHARSPRAFRIDLFDQQETLLPELIGVLAAQSMDAAFLGYPYGLIVADRYARVRDEEKAYLRTRAEAVMGTIMAAQEASVDAHDALNKAV
jgi:hypothetical protein